MSRATQSVEIDLTRAVVSLEVQDVAIRVAEPILEERRTSNEKIWRDPSSWFGPFYFGAADTRLWAPRRARSGDPDAQQRIINFAHPLGRRAFRILATAYSIGLATLGILGAILLGVRW